MKFHVDSVSLPGFWKIRIRMCICICILHLQKKVGMFHVIPDKWSPGQWTVWNTSFCKYSILFCSKQVFDLPWVFGVRIMNNVDTADTTGWLGLVECETEATSKRNQGDWQRQVSISVRKVLAFSKLPHFHGFRFHWKILTTSVHLTRSNFWNLTLAGAPLFEVSWTCDIRYGLQWRGRIKRKNGLSLMKVAWCHETFPSNGTSLLNGSIFSSKQILV